jgi:transposase
MAGGVRHWSYRKVGPADEEEMRRLLEEGLSYSEIARRFGVTLSTVQYHLDASYRNRALKKAKSFWKHRRSRQYGEYQRDYMRERYRDDPEFRERFKEYVRRYRKRRLGLVGKLRRLYPEYDEIIRLYARECYHLGYGEAWRRHKLRVGRLRRKYGVEFPVSI